MKSRVVLSDAALVVVAAALVLILSPGLAVVAIIALIVLAVCGISLGIESFLNRRGRHRKVHRP